MLLYKSFQRFVWVTFKDLREQLSRLWFSQSYILYLLETLSWFSLSISAWRVLQISIFIFPDMIRVCARIHKVSPRFAIFYGVAKKSFAHKSVVISSRMSTKRRHKNLVKRRFARYRRATSRICANSIAWRVEVHAFQHRDNSSLCSFAIYANVS